MQESIERTIWYARREVDRQVRKWGDNRVLPDISPQWPTPPSPERFAEDLEIPTEARAKFLVETEAQRGYLSWSVILLEEVCEAMAAAARGDTAGLIEELVQVIAVCISWIECIERREPPHG